MAEHHNVMNIIITIQWSFAMVNCQHLLNSMQWHAPTLTIINSDINVESMGVVGRGGEEVEQGNFKSSGIIIIDDNLNIEPKHFTFSFFFEEILALVS